MVREIKNRYLIPKSECRNTFPLPKYWYRNMIFCSSYQNQVRTTPSHSGNIGTETRLSVFHTKSRIPERLPAPELLEQKQDYLFFIPNPGSHNAFPLRNYWNRNMITCSSYQKRDDRTPPHINRAKNSPCLPCPTTSPAFPPPAGPPSSAGTPSASSPSAHGCPRTS